MRNIKFYLFFLTTFLIASCSKDGGDTPVPESTAPEFVSSVPANQATGVAYDTGTVQLVFDRAITVVSAAKITLNNVVVTEALASDKTLTVTLPKLKGSTQYTLKIGVSAIKAIPGTLNTNEVSISFTTGAEPVYEISKSLVTSNPSSQAVKVYNFLLENYRKKIISGAMAKVNWNISDATWVNYKTGKYPAINCFDYIHLQSSPANWIDYGNTQVVEDWWNNNGLVACMWHWIVPKSQGSTDYTYVPAETTFKASNATVEGTWENNIVKADLEKISGYLGLLKAKGIPVIWRPLHEAAGNIYAYSNGTAWFWWGASGADAYKKLWIYMFNYFQNKGLNNLIWVWTTQTGDNDFYPGDNYVDIVGRDLYGQDSNNLMTASQILAQYQTIEKEHPTKMVTLSECGSVATITNQLSAGATWSWFMPWYDYDRTDTGDTNKYANAAFWADAVGNANVITRDKMPSLK